MSFPDREGHHFFIVGSDTGRVIEEPLDSPLWPLDHAVVNRGTVVPQTMWLPDSVPDTWQRSNLASLQMPIFFEGIDGRLGVSLEAAAAGQCHHLRDAQHFAPLGKRSTTKIRIAWLGYKDSEHQVSILDESNTRNLITVAKFAQRIGRSVDTFLQCCELDPETTDSEQLWHIGPCGIQRSDIIVIGAINVSAGSWMPIFQLNRHIR